MKITRIGVDIVKSIFHVHGVDRHDGTRGHCFNAFSHQVFGVVEPLLRQ